MSYCYPGRRSGGDILPRRECATLWLEHLRAKLPRIELTLLIGPYAQRHFWAHAASCNHESSRCSRAGSVRLRRLG